MTDLVERLRISAQRSNLNNEAADEIERNRAELIALKHAINPFLAESDGTDLIPDHVRVTNMLERNREAIAELCAAIQLASDMVSDWGAYASPYLQNKHDLKGDIAQLQSIITKHSTTTEKRK